VDDTKPSKSARKRAYQALQKLGEELIPLLESDLRSLDLDEELLGAVLDAKRMTKRGALRRQKQYIGKLMNRVDPEPIRAALLRLRNK
jgi:ribosome-associated protein